MQFSILSSPLRLLPLLLCGVLAACSQPHDPGYALLEGSVDADGDGFMAFEDCDDNNAAMSPILDEICMDGLDNDCDGTDNGCGLEPIIDLSQSSSRLIGERPGDHAGWAVSGGGDINGDGYGDILVGAYEDDEGGEFAGAAYVFFGPVAGSLNLSRADAKLVGEAPFDHAGWSVASAGDLNRDGFDDILVGAYGSDWAGDGAGSVYVVLGPVEGNYKLSDADARLDGASAYDSAGISVAGLGDTDGDGYPDIGIGAYGNDSGGLEAGAAYVFRGPLLGVRSLANADAVLQGSEAGQWFGYDLAGVDDVDGDGLADLLVGAPGADHNGPDTGAAYLYLGPIRGVRTANGADGRLLGEEANDRAGSAVSGAGDVDGDGLADLAVGAWGIDKAAEDSGGAYVVYGPATGERSLADADSLISGERAGDNAGNDLAGAAGGPAPDDASEGRTRILAGPIQGRRPTAEVQRLLRVSRVVFVKTG